MKGITTIASLPSGSGSKSDLPAEVGEKRFADGGYVESGFYAFEAGGLVRLGPVSDKEGSESFEPRAEPVTITIGVNLTEAVRDRVRSAFRRCTAQVQTTPADRQGFEPFAYCERN